MAVFQLVRSAVQVKGVAVGDLHELVQRYLAVWNDPDADGRAKGIADLWADAGRYTDPLVDLSGHEAIGAMITGVRERFPNLVLTLGRAVDGHHNTVRFTWNLVPDQGGDPLVIGLDVAVVDDDGRLTAVYGFLDKLPPAQ